MPIDSDLKKRGGGGEEEEKAKCPVFLSHYPSVFAHNRFGPRTIAMLLGVILFTSLYCASFARNLIKYLQQREQAVMPLKRHQLPARSRPRLVSGRLEHGSPPCHSHKKAAKGPSESGLLIWFSNSVPWRGSIILKLCASPSSPVPFSLDFTFLTEKPSNVAQAPQPEY